MADITKTLINICQVQPFYYTRLHVKTFLNGHHQAF